MVKDVLTGKALPSHDAAVLVMALKDVNSRTYFLIPWLASQMHGALKTDEQQVTEFVVTASHQPSSWWSGWWRLDGAVS
jgi:hypothetical protein